MPWHANGCGVGITWPYPDAMQVRKLMNRTGLNKSQISHFFVNQRKRHWSQAFNRVIPLDEGAVCVFLERKFGSVENGIHALLRL